MTRKPSKYKKNVIQRLDSVLDSAVKRAMSEKEVLSSNGSTFVVGSLLITKIEKKYSISNRKGDIILYDTAFIDNALYLARLHLNGNYNATRKIIQLERDYTKHLVDAEQYLYSYRAAKAKRDEIRMNVAEDRYYLSKQLMEEAKGEMKSITKSFSKRINTRK